MYLKKEVLVIEHQVEVQQLELTSLDFLFFLQYDIYWYIFYQTIIYSIYLLLYNLISVACS